MIFKTNLKHSHNLIDLTPLVDVVFLMLIFFIITSDILPLKSLNIQNPVLEKDSIPLTTQLLVVLDAQNVLYVGSKKMIIDLSSLKTTLQEELRLMQAQHPQHIPTIVLSVDRRVDYGSFLKMFSIAQECCPQIRLVYKPNDSDPTEYL
ncbi:MULTISPECIES: ExbD/TolR family protein [Parachlamydia]|jgi:biopolymer transport protein ExbD|uniref:Biopolymer transporter ExbD n=2 Tax=Parachlamydia acanthamoebae TaxID=83552 RepID=F8L2H3_PARAV|nr:biopolymer transporter ExbD [Parachlamydia acanthamoebae]EFB40172.1 hypothetical protein pah_c253o033 [Parachlamydia acanthamoebae str. Hall's coccus]KIA76833.1 hypothetical protein DB43_HI00180 [Parachlamydia acanthamoebae]CCB87486.1 putative uncharacterized protein [Parachlamydia acanthamoebae UV-7]